MKSVRAGEVVAGIGIVVVAFNDDDGNCGDENVHRRDTYTQNEVESENAKGEW